MASEPPNKDNRITTAEYIASLTRICTSAVNGLTVTPLPAIVSGAFAVYSVSLYEATLWIKNPSPVGAASGFNRYSFMLRYGAYQVIPSLVWETQPASIIAKRVGLSSECIYADASTLQKQNPPNYLRYIRSVSIRGAIAGSILLSQVFSLVNIAKYAQEGYVQRIRDGREPPLDVADEFDNPGVVVRLAGEVSDVTNLSMAREGRRKIFPIFERSDSPNVQALVQNHACDGSASTTGVEEPIIPIYWNCRNGRYGRKDSWRGMRIPPHWLFDVALTSRGVREGRPDKLLILEADATGGESDSLSLKRTTSAELDLDLYEVAQGFHNLEQCVDAPPCSFDTIRVLLVDSEMLVRKGGGYAVEADGYVRALALADVVVDARAPLVFAMTKWLESKPTGLDETKSKRGLFSRKILQPIILETPNEEWFQSIRAEFSALGYEVISFVEALERYGKDGTIDKPLFVYENSIADTVHTIKRLKEQNFARDDMVCALFPHHSDGKDDDASETKYATICSTDIYSQLLLWVRRQALQGHSSRNIQKRLDESLGDILLGKEEIGCIVE